MLKFKVEHQDLILLDTDTIVADSEDYLQMQFSFTDDWNDVIKIALFSRDENNIRVQLNADGIVTVPWNVLKGEGSFNVSVFGNNQEDAPNKVITSSVATILVQGSGLKNGETFDESTAGLEGGVLHQIISKATEAENSAEAAQQSAVAAEDSKTAAERSASAAAESASAAENAAANAAATAAAAAAQQVTESVNQTFSALLNAPYYGYDAAGHLNFYYNRRDE